MAKQKKKRNKVYSGADAAMTRPVVAKITAVNRNPVNQWWFDHKKIAKPALITSVIIVIVGVLIYEIIALIIA